MNPSTSSARTLVDELAQHGVEHVVLSPGSRSAPLAHALATAAASGTVRLHVRIDERTAGFTALGLARVGGPVAVVTTSGTAVANLHPAVLEAAHAGVPLVVLTADRPHEMRGTGANQTTDQVHLFGRSVRFFADVPAPHGRPGEDADLRNVLARALAAATGSRTGSPGPVHLDLAFREPLVPEADPVLPPPALHSRRVGATQVDPVGVLPAPLVLPEGPRTVVVAGDRAGTPARLLAEAGGFPLLAEPSSGARCGAQAVGPYRLLLDRSEFGARIERVVVFGHPTLSRPVTSLLGRHDVEVVVVGRNQEWPDAGRRADRVATSVEVEGPARDGDWLASWQQAGKTAQQAVEAVLAGGALTGPLVAAEVWAARQPGEYLVVASSNPIRDLDLAAAPLESDDAMPDGSVPDGSVLANRGLSGIDGTMSTASGVALGTGRPTRVLLGDLAFLHDAGGLLTGPLEEQPQLQAVVVNDGGGGIFSLLEHGEPAYAATFERVFGTPHGADLGQLCAGYGVAHTRVHDLSGLRDALASSAGGRSVIEAPVDRRALRDLHARIKAAVSAVLDG